MKVTVRPSAVTGTVRAIHSKSFAHRQLICAALAESETKISCRVISEDIRATMRCLMALGASIGFKDGIISVTPVTSPKRGAMLDCGESGSTYRFLAPVAAAFGATGAGISSRRNGPAHALSRPATQCEAARGPDGIALRRRNCRAGV